METITCRRYVTSAMLRTYGTRNVLHNICYQYFAPAEHNSIGLEVCAVRISDSSGYRPVAKACRRM